MHLLSFGRAPRRVLDVDWILNAVISLVVVELAINHSKAELHVRFRGVFLDLVLELLVETHSAIRHQNIIDLLEVEVNMVVMVRILVFMLFTLFLLLGSGHSLLILPQI